MHIEQVLALKPDLILANKEENDREQVQQLEQYCPVWTSDIKNLSDALRMIEHIGELTGTASRAKEISQEIATKMEVLIPPAHPLQKAVYLIWRKPYMTVGGDTFIHDMLQYAGFSNAFKHLSRYPECAASDLPEAAPDYILLSSEPFPFQQKHLRELEEICPNAKVILVDGAFFSWYGSRLLRAATYFGGLLG